MTTLKSTSGYTLEFSSKTYLICDEHGTCLLATDTLRKANNFFNKTLKLAGIQC